MKTHTYLATATLAFFSTFLIGAGPSSPSLPVTAAFLSAGGGAGSFSTVRAFSNLIGEDELQSELRSLRATYGQHDVDRFVRSMDFAIDDGWKHAGEDDVKIPPPSGDSGKELVRDMIAAGTPAGGTFQMKTMMDALLTEPVHTQVGTDLAARYGNDSAANFERIGTQFFTDLARSM